MMNGLPCSGKTITSRYLAKQLGTLRLSTNEIRVKLNISDLFNEDQKNIVYRCMITCGIMLVDKSSVVLDATFSSAIRRKWLFTELAAINQSLILVRCHCDDQSSKKRLLERKSKPDIPEFQGKLTYEYVKNSEDQIQEDEFNNLEKVSWIDFDTGLNRAIMRFEKSISHEAIEILNLLNNLGEEF